MKPFRLTIAGLMALVIVAGVIQVALWKADPLWASAVMSLSIVCIVAAVLAAAITPRGVGRAGYIGASLFGATYLTLCFVPPFDGAIRPHLLTSQLLLWIHPRLNYGAESGPYLWPPYHTEEAQIWLKDTAGQDRLVRASVVNWGHNREHFERLCHSLFALILAGAGCLLGRALWVRGRVRASRSSPGGDG